MTPTAISGKPNESYLFQKLIETDESVRMPQEDDPVRDEDGTAADMESRFAKEYSIDALRHDFSDAVFALVRSGERLFAASANGQVKQFTIAGPTAKFDINTPACGEAFIGQQDQLINLVASPKVVCAASFTRFQIRTIRRRRV